MADRPLIEVESNPTLVCAASDDGTERLAVTFQMGNVVHVLNEVHKIGARIRVAPHGRQASTKRGRPIDAIRELFQRDIRSQLGHNDT